MKLEIQNNIGSYIYHQVKQLNILKRISSEFLPFQEIDFDIADCALLDLNYLNLYHSIYLIQVREFGEVINGGNFCKIIEKVKEKNKKKFKLPKINFENSGSKFLYIGKSTGSLKLRLEQHFKSNITKTYALHLCRWNDNEKLRNMKFTLYYTSLDFEKFGIEERSQQKDLLEMAESALHKEHKPLLGRSGH